MPQLTETGMEAARFAAYIDELREFSASCGIPYGSAEDLYALVDNLHRDGTFRGECTSMIRSIIYRQHGTLLSTELLTLIASAWGGPQVLEAADSFQQPLGSLQGFLAKAMRPARGEETEPFLEEPLPVEGEEFAPVPGYSPRRTTGIFEGAAAIVQAEPVPMLQSNRGDRHEEVVASTPPEGIEETIHFLESSSPDVRLYIDLMVQRKQKDLQLEVVSEEVFHQVVKASLSPETSLAEDPWDEQSELQIDLRRFAEQRLMQRKLRAAAYRAERESHSIKNNVRHAAEVLLAHLRRIPGFQHHRK